MLPMLAMGAASMLGGSGGGMGGMMSTGADMLGMGKESESSSATSSVDYKGGEYTVNTGGAGGSMMNQVALIAVILIILLFVLKR